MVPRMRERGAVSMTDTALSHSFIHAVPHDREEGELILLTLAVVTAMQIR